MAHAQIEFDGEVIAEREYTIRDSDPLLLVRGTLENPGSASPTAVLSVVPE